MSPVGGESAGFDYVYGRGRDLVSEERAGMIAKATGRGGWSARGCAGVGGMAYELKAGLARSGG